MGQHSGNDQFLRPEGCQHVALCRLLAPWPAAWQPGWYPASPLPRTWTWVLEPTQAIRGNKVGPSPTHPFLYPSNTLTLHTGAPLFSAGSVRQTVASNASKGPKQQSVEKKLTCTNSASSFLTLKISRKCFFLCFHPLLPLCFHLSVFLLTCPCYLTEAFLSASVPVASSSSPRVAPDLEQARPTTSGEEELQLQLALAMSREESEKVALTRSHTEHGFLAALMLACYVLKL